MHRDRWTDTETSQAHLWFLLHIQPEGFPSLESQGPAPNKAGFREPLPKRPLEDWKVPTMLQASRSFPLTCLPLQVKVSGDMKRRSQSQKVVPQLT